MSDISARLLRIEEKLSDTREDVQYMRAEVAAFIAQASARLEENELETTAARAEAKAVAQQLKWIRIWAAAAVVLVPGTLGVVAWFLSAIPAAAWSHVAK